MKKKYDYLSLHSSDKTLELVSLHDHPCGSGDGGEFPCHEFLYVNLFGQFVYQWDVPEAPNGAFDDEKAEDYCFLPTKEDAVRKLLETQKKLQEEAELVRSLLSALETADYVTVRTTDEDE